MMIEAMRSDVERLIVERGGYWRAGNPADIKPGNLGHCDPIHKEIIGPAIASMADYAVWLHEIGHSYQHVDSTRFWLNPVPFECQAWQWAMQNAMGWTEDCQTVMYKTLMAYVESPDHPEWGVDSNYRLVGDTLAIGRRLL